MTLLYFFLNLIFIVNVIINSNFVNGILWPEMTCHKWYDHTRQTTFAVANRQCRAGTELRTHLVRQFLYKIKITS